MAVVLFFSIKNVALWGSSYRGGWLSIGSILTLQGIEGRPKPKFGTLSRLSLRSLLVSSSVCFFLLKSVNPSASCFDNGVFECKVVDSRWSIFLLVYHYD